MTNNQLRALMQQMREMGWFEYGTSIPAERYRELLGISYPKTGTKEEYDRLELAELSAIDFIREQLLKEGRFLKRDGEFYRILLPSENEIQIDAYMRNAQRKLSRAIKLGKNTPGRSVAIDNAIVRATMKSESIRNR
ncbi:hypothetical protein [Nitratifractor sp.]|uniref:hypothetical protein n=1 Tax=Nitratifractor sp. TaxID=2268144 RepID=UPI0025F94AFD|nr:hypothetical protein [Nitratifractor sp.]